MEKHVFHPTNEGTPQGGIASPVFANMALNGLEQQLRKKYPLRSDGSCRDKVYLVRYADDFVITGNSQEQLEHEVKPLVEQFMRERGLELSPEKTVITHIETGFNFLGQNVRKYDGKMLIKPSAKSVQTLMAKARKIVKANPTTTPGKLILQLNPLIKGWAMYHRHVVSKETFAKIDHYIFQLLWAWAVRRHPKKSHRWIKQKYFQAVVDRNWVFTGTVSGREGTTRTVKLYNAALLPIRRHVKLRGDANPYDPEWEPYFESRLDVKMEQTLAGRRKLLFLWREQNGVCPVCNQKITKITGWHSHHILWRSKGGGPQADNRVLLHPNCHRQVHSQGVSVAKPRLGNKASGEA
jgi:RNA-directed DNA polymerase